MTAMRLVWVLGLLIFIGGCSVVLSERPVGETPVVLNPAEWDGTWSALEGGPVVIQVNEKEKGQLKLGWIEGSRGEIVLKKATVTIMRSGKTDFANLLDEEKTDKGPRKYLFAKVKRAKGIITFWLPREDRFADLIKKGILPGTATKEETILGPLGPEHMKIITSEEKGVLFDWESPFILIRSDSASER